MARASPSGSVERKLVGVLDLYLGLIYLLENTSPFTGGSPQWTPTQMLFYVSQSETTRTSTRRFDKRSGIY